jgi:hypothetical protein
MAFSNNHQMVIILEHNVPTKFQRYHLSKMQYVFRWEIFGANFSFMVLNTRIPFLRSMQKHAKHGQIQGSIVAFPALGSKFPYNIRTLELFHFNPPSPTERVLFNFSEKKNMVRLASEELL